MNFDITQHTILKVKHGSHAYGLNTPTSDLDIKGICIEPIAYHFGAFSRFEQHIQEASKGAPADLTIFSLKKYVKLASDCNPNMIEILFGHDDDILSQTSHGARLRENRNLFLSTRAHYTFAGYAHAQLKRIKSHRSWLLNAPKAPPARADFGLSDIPVDKTAMGAFDVLSGKALNELSAEATTLFNRERAYRTKQREWQQYQDWLANRNPKRAATEAKFHYDTKHGMHLLRLMRMAVEIVRDGKVNVRREDREELLAVRNGQVSYDDLIEQAEKLESLSKEAYPKSPLPRKANIKAIEKLTVSITEDFLNAH